MNESLKSAYDAIIVGSGPNGLSAAIALRREGLNVLIIEREQSIGGGMRSAELTMPGFIHDICSAIHPMSAGSPFFQTIPLQEFGMEYIHSPIAAAHPFDDGSVALLKNSIDDTASSLGEDQASYKKLMTPLVSEWPLIVSEVLGPLHIPHHLRSMTKFGSKALLPASAFVNNYFKGEKAKGFFGGMAAHGMLPLNYIASAAAGLTLLIQGHIKGWPLIKGGSKQLATALASYFISLGGQIQTGVQVNQMQDIPSAKAVLFDVSPKELLRIAGTKFSGFYRRQLERYRYGMGVFKVDWALNEPIPFKVKACLKAATVHLGDGFEEISFNEKMTIEGGHPEKPFVILAQQSIFDSSRAPDEKHTAWAYCHVPNGSIRNMKEAIEKQVERFAPGFQECILSSHTMNTKQFEIYNPNYVGGDINGGVMDIRQLYTRPAIGISPYRTSAKGIYICSASTPPGGGVHGMCGYHAAKRVLKDVFV